MKIHLLASGSSGNCTLITAGEGIHATRICLDCGIPQRTARLLAERCGETLANLDGVLMTHHHADHSANVIPIAARANAPLYAHSDSFGNKTKLSLKERERRNIQHISFQDGVPFQIGAISVTPIALPHDAGPTFGFQLEADGVRAGFFTDLGIADVLAAWIPNFHYLVIEANHDLSMLRNGPYPQVLIDRVSGPQGHLSNQQTANILQQAAGPGLKQVVLAHLSKQNNSPEKALATIRPQLHPEVHLQTAPPIGPLTIGENCAV